MGDPISVSSGAGGLAGGLGLISAFEGGSSRTGRAVDAGKKGLKKDFLSGGLRGLSLAPEFFRLLGSPDLAGTQLGLGNELATSLLQQAIGGLEGINQGLPESLNAGFREGLASQLGALGLESSPVASIIGAEKYTDLTERVRAFRLQSALQVLGGAGQGAVFPSASQFTSLGAEQSAALAGFRFQGAEALSNREQDESKALGSSIGSLATSLAFLL